MIPISRMIVLLAIVVLCLVNPKATSAQMCAETSCPDSTSDFDCNSGVWPGGIVYYDWYKTCVNISIEGDAGLRPPCKDNPSPEMRMLARQAMNDWEAVSNGAVHFVYSTTANPRIRLRYLSSSLGNFIPSYNVCKANLQTGSYCDGNFHEADVYHELGHALGAGWHTQDRYDRRHYMRINSNPLGRFNTCPNPPWQRCGTAEHAEQADFGPFDYYSARLYATIHPDFTRFDGSPMCPGTTCGNFCNQRPAPCIADKCPTCTNCQTKQPGGFPTKADGAAIVEAYLYGPSSGWKKFKRTVEEDTGSGATTPWNYDVAPGVIITSSQSPAVETREWGTLSLYVRGSDDHVYEKRRISGTGLWTPWTDLGAPPSPSSRTIICNPERVVSCDATSDPAVVSNSTSDPAVVSWVAGRTDLVVRRSSTIYIKTFSGGAWSTWQSLGSPASSPSSAPAITSWGDNRLDVLIRGADNQLYWKKCTATCNGAGGRWSAWQAITGGKFKGKPTVVSRASGYLDVFVHGMDDRLWGIESINDVWSGWYLVNSGGILQWDAGCPDCSSPAAGSRGSGTIDVMVRGLDDEMWITTWTGGSTWTSFAPVGGVLSSSPGTVSRSRFTNRIDVAVIMPEENADGNFHYGVWWKEYTP
jgi:astacin (peptidase family M12A)